MRILLSLVALLGLTFASLPSLSQSDAPNLVGTWECEDATIVYREGEWTQIERTIEVFDQRNGVFHGENTWRLESEDGPLGALRGEETPAGTMALVGAIGFDNETFHGSTMAEADFQGRIISDDTIDILFTEVGDNAWASRTTCSRSTN